MEFRVLNKKSLDQIKPLWEQLNSLHETISSNFKSHYASITFEERTRKLCSKSHVRVFTAVEHGKNVGYCIASRETENGEIDSLFILPDCRRRGIGKALMKNALSWLKEEGCAAIEILVADGNEQVFPFYEQFGFKPRATLLRNAESLINT